MLSSITVMKCYHDSTRKNKGCVENRRVQDDLCKANVCAGPNSHSFTLSDLGEAGSLPVRACREATDTANEDLVRDTVKSRTVCLPRPVLSPGYVVCPLTFIAVPLGFLSAG